MKKTIITLVASALILLVLNGCVHYHTAKGNRYYDALGYSKAIHHFEKIYPEHATTEIECKLADSYFKTAQIDSAERLYHLAVMKQDVLPHAHFDLAKVLMYKGMHHEAVQHFKEYLKLVPRDRVAQMLLSSCQSVYHRYRDTTLFKLKPIRKQEFVNAFSSIEYQNGAIFSADKEVFSGRKTSSWTGNSYLDLYYMEKDSSGNWMKPELLTGDINGRFHEGPATFTEDGNTVFFTRSNYFKRKLNANDQMESNLKIFKASFVEGKWKNLEEFPYNSDEYSCGHPTLSKDGKTMYFVSDMPSGSGGTDIYKSTYYDGVWSIPENIGTSVNTEGNEMFPYLHEDGALYFSSDAHNSMGGLDVFITYFNGWRWVKPENLNYPLNSIKDDFGFSLNKDNRTGFVSSSRASADKIYSFEKLPPTFNLYGKAREKGTQIPVKDVVVEITMESTGELIKMISDEQGRFNMKLNPETSYHLYCTKFGCFTRTDHLSTKGLKYSEDFYADFEVEPIVINKPIVLENIYYDFDKWDIREDAAIELDKLVRVLADNPLIDIEMGSHTDVRGNDQYNEVLSEKRAMAAVKYLISKGIDSKRLTYKGYGEKVLVNRCANGIQCTEEEHQKNRRTEFKVIRVREQ
jgi:outer membrane protein OmpA-like peptidoglycan-associated protein